MEKISKDEVKHLAELSSISLSEEEISNLQTDLGNIVEYIEQLGELSRHIRFRKIKMFGARMKLMIMALSATNF